MKYILSITFFAVALNARSSKLIVFKTILNKNKIFSYTVTGNIFFITKNYFQDSRGLILFTDSVNDGININLKNVDYGIIRNKNNSSKKAEFIDNKWLPTKVSPESILRSFDKNKTKNIFGFKCYKVVFFDTTNMLTSIGWATNELPRIAGIKLINNFSYAILEYENNFEKTGVVSINVNVPESWLNTYENISKSFEKYIIDTETKGETKLIEINKKFPQFEMVDLDKRVWSDKDLVNHLTIMIIWLDIFDQKFGSEMHFKTDYNFLEKLQTIMKNYKNKNFLVLAPTISSGSQIIEKHSHVKELKGVKIIPSSEDWISNKVKIKKYPTIIFINKKGTVIHKFEFHHQDEEYKNLKILIEGLKD